MLLDLDFAIHSELDACNSPCTATTCVDGLADAIACWSEMVKLETRDPLESRRLAELLVQYRPNTVQYNKNNQSTEFLWLDWHGADQKRVSMALLPIETCEKLRHRNVTCVLVQGGAGLKGTSTVRPFSCPSWSSSRE
jgi:hypothetical protein